LLTALGVSADCTESCFDAPEWQALLERDPNRHIFVTPEWGRGWWEEFKKEKDLFILRVRRGSEVVALVPLYRKVEEGRRIFRFLGGIDLSDYLGPICSLEDRNDVAAALAVWLRDTDVLWDEFDAHNMPVPLGFAEFLVDHVDRADLAFELEQEETAAVLILPSDWDGYLAVLAKKQRHELRRKIRKLWNEHADARVRTSTPGTLDDDLGTFFAMHRGAEGHKGHFMNPEMATFFARIARTFMPLGWMKLDLLEDSGGALAATFSFEHNARFYLYNSAFEPSAAAVSPGLVLVAHLLERSIQQKLERFDFLRGPERYKYQLGAQAVPLNNVRVFRNPTRINIAAREET
jgi:CelD/BcsL family acetyltransferase involved in cellulose biosynthesis